MGTVEHGREGGDFKQGLACIDEPLQPKHGLCYRAIVIYTDKHVFQIVQL